MTPPARSAVQSRTADLDRRQCRPGGAPHGTARLFLARQPARRIAQRSSGNGTAIASAGRGEPPDATARPICLELHVAPTHEEAVETARPFLEGKYAAYAEWGQDKVLPGEESFRVGFDDLARDRFHPRTAEEVIEQIGASGVRRLDSNYLIFRMGWPGMQAATILRVIEMMGTQVLPLFSTTNTAAADGCRPNPIVIRRRPVSTARSGSRPSPDDGHFCDTRHSRLSVVMSAERAKVRRRCPKISADGRAFQLLRDAEPGFPAVRERYQSLSVG